MEPVWPLLPGADASAALAAAAAAAVSGGASAGSALFALPSLLNHACAPAAAPAWDGARGAGARLRLVATRDLAAGEAVTISYVDDELPVRLRRAQLEDAYGFVCGCSRCVAEGAGGD